MLFKQIHLQGIKNGTITLAFRKWKKTLVKKGSVIKTSIGQLEIIEISEVHAEVIKLQDARRAGYDELSELIRILDKRADGNIYRIQVKYHSPDPRIALRNKPELSTAEIEGILMKLKRLDKFSNQGPWTHEVLQAIRSHPKLRAKDLSSGLGKEKDWLKINIRKLKNLGLTISHQQGYTISPRGKAILNVMNKILDQNTI
jgi:hypothetical protein